MENKGRDGKGKWKNETLIGRAWLFPDFSGLPVS
jgi:hypothetical protein